jgi:hypothetical protein
MAPRHLRPRRMHPLHPLQWLASLPQPPSHRQRFHPALHQRKPPPHPKKKKAPSQLIKTPTQPLVFVFLVIVYKLNDRFRHGGTLGRHTTNLFTDIQSVDKSARRGNLRVERIHRAHPKAAVMEILRFLKVWIV